MFDTAVKIAKSSQYDNEGLSDIFKNYADHLYSKGNFAGELLAEFAYKILKISTSSRIHGAICENDWISRAFLCN